MAGGKRNLILGFCTGYRLSAIEPFLASAVELGDSARLCLFTNGLDEAFYHAASRHGIRVEDASPYLNMDYHPQNSRYFAYRQFIRDTAAEYNQVLMTDVRDVFFQSDPFAIRHPRPVCISLEDTRIKWEPTHNQRWLRDIYGEDVLADVTENFVACSGTTIGTMQGVAAYLDVLCTELETRAYDRMQVYDQGIHNYIVWKLRPDWAWIDTGDSVVNTVGCTSPERIEVMDDLAVVDGRVPPVVHQWDRHAHLRALVERAPRFRLPG